MGEVVDKFKKDKVKCTVMSVDYDEYNGNNPLGMTVQLRSNEDPNRFVMFDSGLEESMCHCINVGDTMYVNRDEFYSVEAYYN